MEEKIKIDFPDKYKKDIIRAVQILKDSGCSEVYLFGSLSTGEYRKKSDIDLAVKGCPKGNYFSILGKLLFELKHSVDLINLDKGDTFSRYLETEGELVKID